MRTISLYICTLMFFFLSCEKKNENTIDANILFNNIKAYSNDSASLSFNVIIEDNTHDIIVEWITPEELKNKRSGILTFTEDIQLQFNLRDSNFHVLNTIEKFILIDTVLVKNEYDFRNDYEGDFLFNIHHYAGWIDGEGNSLDTNYSVNGFVQKKGELSNSLLEINYGSDTIMVVQENGIEKIVTENSDLLLSLNNYLSYPGDIGGYGHTYVRGKFLSFDTLNLNISSGGLGSWDTRKIVAIRIENR